MLFISLEIALIMKNYSVFCFHLGCGLGLYLLRTIQMLLGRQNYEYSCWLSTWFATVVSTSLLFSISSMVWGTDQVLAEDSLLCPEVGWVKIWRSLLSKENFLLTCPSPHNVPMRWRGYNPNFAFDGQQSSKTVFFNSKFKRLGYQPVHWPLILRAVKLEAQSLAKWQLHTMPWPVLGN